MYGQKFINCQDCKIYHWWCNIDDNSICFKRSQEPSMVDSSDSHAVSGSIPQKQACPCIAGHVSTGKVFPVITHHLKWVKKDKDIGKYMYFKNNFLGSNRTASLIQVISAVSCTTSTISFALMSNRCP